MENRRLKFKLYLCHFISVMIWYKSNNYLYCCFFTYKAEIIILTGQYQNQIDYILCSQRWRSCIQSAKTRPGTDCGSENQLFIEKFRLKLKMFQAGSRKGRGTRGQIANICCIIEKTREFQKNIYLCFIDYAKAFDCGS